MQINLSRFRAIKRGDLLPALLAKLTIDDQEWSGLACRKRIKKKKKKKKKKERERKEGNKYNVSS